MPSILLIGEQYAGILEGVRAIGGDTMKSDLRIEGLPSVFRTHRPRAGLLFLALSMSMAWSPARAQGDVPSGKQVVDSVCGACHATGLNGAPKIGDQQAWSGRASQGLSSLTVHALQGIRNMPAHGGDPKLSDLEIARAITYMVNQSGGNWIEPASAKDLSAEKSGEQVVKAQCAKCHAEGVGGAPKIGDLQAWVQRMKNGLPYLVSSAIHGHGGMPPRGGEADLTDTELRSAILYMYNPAGMPARATSAAAKPGPAAVRDPNHQSVDGVGIYLGFVPAAQVRALPKDAPERSMHGGIPQGPGYYHINVSLLDEKSQTPIEGATVRMQFDWPGLSSPPITLEPMLLGGSYGNYVKPQPGTPYVITLHINRPGETQTVDAKFTHKFQ
jgi:cytochrome c5